MTPTPVKLLADLRIQDAGEEFQTLLKLGTVRIERIASYGHSSPADFWYDQPDTEWVVLLQGSAVLAFENNERVTMHAGDALTIAAHVRHRVEYTGPDTVWLAVHIGETGETEWKN